MISWLEVGLTTRSTSFLLVVAYVVPNVERRPKTLSASLSLIQQSKPARICECHRLDLHFSMFASINDAGITFLHVLPDVNVF